jgi:hypothetical protein
LDAWGGGLVTPPITGRRLPDQSESMHTFEPGDYGLVRSVDGQVGWYCHAPWHHAPGDYGPRMQGNLANHEVVEHDDGTITVSPSILINTTWGPERTAYRWHGFLQAGVWTTLDDTSAEPTS